MVCCSFISCGAVQWLGNLTYASFLLYFPLPLLLVLFLGGGIAGFVCELEPVAGCTGLSLVGVSGPAVLA